jgi:hypothetical protein
MARGLSGAGHLVDAKLPGHNCEAPNTLYGLYHSLKPESRGLMM